MSCAVIVRERRETGGMIPISLHLQPTTKSSPQLDISRSSLSEQPTITSTTLSPSQQAYPNPILHPDILRQVLDHLPPTNLPSLLRVSSVFYHTIIPILYSSIAYLPDRSGPTCLDGLGSQPLDLKAQALLCTRTLSLGYHHHNSAPFSPSHFEPTASSAPSRTNEQTKTKSITSLSLHLPSLQTLRISGERFCTHKSCPYLSQSSPSTIIIDKIDLFSGSPRWKNPFLLPTPHKAKHAIYLVQSPFFLRRSKMQGLHPTSTFVPKQTFIFALREYEMEWRDTASRMSDKQSNWVLVDHLVTLCLMPVMEEVEVVGVELVSGHLRVVDGLESVHPEDLVESFERAVEGVVRMRWESEGVDGRSVEDQLARVRFTSMREYAARRDLPDTLDRELLEKWAACFEHAVASSGVHRRA